MDSGGKARLVLLKTAGKIAGVFLLGVVVLAISSGIAQVLTSSSGDDSAGHGWMGPALTHLLMLILSIACFVIIGKGSVRRFGVRFGMPRWVLKALVVGLVIGLLVNLILPDVKMLEGYSPLAIILLAWIWASICEEVLCRGLLQSLFAMALTQAQESQRMLPSAPVVLAALFFALMHLPVIMLGVPPGAVVILVMAAFALGLIAGYVREHTGSLLPAIVVHSLFNFSGSIVDWLIR